MNVYTAVRYARDILRSATESQIDKVVIDREKLRAIVKNAEHSPGYIRDRRIFMEMKTLEEGE